MAFPSTCLLAFRISTPVDRLQKLSLPKGTDASALSVVGLISNLGLASATRDSHRRSRLRTCGRLPSSRSRLRRHHLMALSDSTNSLYKHQKPKSSSSARMDLPSRRFWTVKDEASMCREISRFVASATTTWRPSLLIPEKAAPQFEMISPPI